MSDLRDIAVKNAHRLSAPDYSKLLNLADEVERLTVRNKNQCERLDQQIKHNADLLNRNAKLQAVVDAVKDIKWRSIDKDNMEFATTCFVVDRIRIALAALEDE